MHVTRDRLRADLRRLGLAPGDAAVVHSSLSSLGWVEGGADAVIDALLDAVGEEGTLLVPTFTSGATDTEPFVRVRTPSRTGAVTEAVRRRPASARSRHPTHSVTALGRDAADLVVDHSYAESLGVDSPLHRAVERGAKILLLGVDHTSNSAVHVAEKQVGLPFKGRPKSVLTHEEGNDVARVQVSRVGCSQGFGVVGEAADREGLVARGRVGEADAQLLPGAALLALVRDLLADDPGALLCDDSDCWWCPEARATLADAG